MLDARETSTVAVESEWGRTESAPSSGTMSRRGLLALGAASLVFSEPTFAQDLTSRPVKLIVGAPPGGSNDFGARLIAPFLGEALGTTVIVENKLGAAGVIASDFVAKSAPDGTNLLFCSASPIVIAPQAMSKAPFNFLTDITSINMVGQMPQGIAVSPSLGVKTLQDLLALSRTRQVTLASSGTGGLPHLIIESLIAASGGSIVHVPYKGGGPGVADAVGGHISGVVQDIPTFIPLHQDGRLLVIAVTSEKRLEFLPDVPTASETLPGFIAMNFLGLYATSKTPKPIINRINSALMKVVAREEFRAQFRKAAIVPGAMATPEAFHKFATDEYHRWGKIVREKNIVITS